MHRILARTGFGFRPAAMGCWLLLAACGHGNNYTSDGSQQTADSVSLPKPAAITGSVTGMPARPGPGSVGPPTADATSPAVIAPAEGGASDATPQPAPGDAESTAAGDFASADEPTQADAADVIRDYYASIDSGNYSHAWSLWSDSGRASGQTLQQFADGFANTAHVTLDVGTPGAMDAAAGSRFIQLPVTIDATARDGSVQHYSGTYVLRRSVVDGATAEQRAWRITSATMHVVAQ